MSEGAKTEDGGEGDGPKPSPQVAMASKRFQQTQAQVDEVVGIMRTNVERVLERDTKLSELVCNASSFKPYLLMNSHEIELWLTNS